MTDAISDLFALPVFVLLLCLFVLGILYATIFLMNNASNNDINTQCIRFADALNTYVSINAGFSDAGSGSFADYVSEYLRAKPIKSPCHVMITVTDKNGSKYTSGFLITPGLARGEHFSDSVYNQLRVSMAGQGSSSPVLDAGTNGVLPEGCEYSITVTPTYLSYKTRGQNAGTTAPTIQDNVGDPLPNALCTYNNQFYEVGSRMVVSGKITNYTKKVKTNN